MTTKRGVIYAIALSVLGAALWFSRRGHDKKVDEQTKSIALAPTEQTKVIVDTRNHTITTVSRDSAGKTKTTATFLPGSGASVSIGLDKSVFVTTRSWGTEVNPFVGCALGSDIRGRAALGLNLFYVKRWEIGGGLLLSSDIHDTRIFAHVGYNAYGNIFIAGGIDNRKTAQLIAALKF